MISSTGRMPIIGVEAGAASAIAGAAAAVVFAYLADWLGFTFAPFAIVPLSVVVAAAVFAALWRRAAADPPALAAFTAIVLATFAWLMPWLPYVFFAGSFMEQSFLSQVVSELFAVAMWWTLVVWSDRASAGMMACFALFGAAAFLTWPVWVGPLVLMLVAVLSSAR